MARVSPDPSPESPESEPARTSLFAHRTVAIIEVLICADLLTQQAIGGTLAALGYMAMVGGRLNLVYVVILSLADTLLLIGLILLILRAHGERPGEVLFGRRSIGREVIVVRPMSALLWACVPGRVPAVIAKARSRASGGSPRAPWRDRDDLARR